MEIHRGPVPQKPQNDESAKRLARCCFSGHRPEKLQWREAAVREMLHSAICAAISDGLTTFISGMSRGADLWAAQAVLSLRKENPDLKLICAVPYRGFAAHWPTPWQQLYQQILAQGIMSKPVFRLLTAVHFQCAINGWSIMPDG